MKSFLEFLEERALLVGDKSKVYPRFNQIIIAAGGAGSGKGFVLKNVLGIEGKTFDVDAMKEDLIKFAKLKKDSDIAKDYKEKYGKDLADIDLKNPTDTSNLHAFVKERGLVEKKKESFFLAAAQTQNKPNVIFDMTFKDMKALSEVVELAELGGYKKENIHIVWIVNDIEIAREQNAKRDRSVADSILVQTHTGAAMTMKKFIENNEQYRQYADGDVWMVFNKKGVDSALKFSDSSKNFVVDKYKALKIKSKGMPADSINDISREINDKIISYVPKGAW